MSYQLIAKKQAEIQPDIDLLDEGERNRYERYVSPQKKQEFLAGRTLLKQTLGAYLGLPSRSVTLTITANGKPILPIQADLNPPFFNLSHAQGNYLVGVSQYPIGVDIEVPRSVILSEVRHFLTSGEYTQLKSIPNALFTDLFFRLFTAKEAFLKATDKRWTLDAVEFQLGQQQWKLVAPGGSFRFYLSAYRGCYTAVCLDLS